MPILSAYDSSIAPSPRWTLDRVDQRDLPLQGSYQFNKRGLGVHVWIVDTGLDITDPDIAANVDQSTYMTINGLNPFAPCDPHGTDVAKAAVGRVGVARGATLHAARVDTDCSGSLSNGAIIFALEYIADNTLRPAVVNLSLGRRCSLFTCLFTVESAAEYAQSKGVTVVVSAGNDGGDACDQSPARLQSLITVGASTLSDARADYPGLWASNWGACVDLFAPVFPSGGTSAAAPVVAGAAALFLEMFPTASPATVQANLVANATVGRLGPNLAGSPNRLLYTMQRTLTAAISGASHIGPFTSCAWYGSHDGGYPPYVYKWYRDQVLVGQSTSYSIEAGESAGFALELRVEDGRGNIASSARAVAFDSNNGGFVCQ
ncbi:MAG: S8 family serine peptidase [Gemmatimonadaceae bacterium]|nr:S8 family serine peptidase [Gemmatimonadaceae bacterium]